LDQPYTKMYKPDCHVPIQVALFVTEQRCEMTQQGPFWWLHHTRKCIAILFDICCLGHVWAMLAAAMLLRLVIAAAEAATSPRRASQLIEWHVQDGNTPPFASWRRNKVVQDANILICVCMCVYLLYIPNVLPFPFFHALLIFFKKTLTHISTPSLHTGHFLNSAVPCSLHSMQYTKCPHTAGIQTAGLSQHA